MKLATSTSLALKPGPYLPLCLEVSNHQPDKMPSCLLQFHIQLGPEKLMTQCGFQRSCVMQGNLTEWKHQTGISIASNANFWAWGILKHVKSPLFAEQFWRLRSIVLASAQPLTICSRKSSYPVPWVYPRPDKTCLLKGGRSDKAYKKKSRLP